MRLRLGSWFHFLAWQTALTCRPLEAVDGWMSDGQRAADSSFIGSLSLAPMDSWRLCECHLFVLCEWEILKMSVDLSKMTASS